MNTNTVCSCSNLIVLIYLQAWSLRHEMPFWNVSVSSRYHENLGRSRSRSWTSQSRSRSRSQTWNQSLGLQKNLEGFGLGLVSDSKSKVSVSSWSRTTTYCWHFCLLTYLELSIHTTCPNYCSFVCLYLLYQHLQLFNSSLMSSLSSLLHLLIFSAFCFCCKYSNITFIGFWQPRGWISTKQTFTQWK